MIYNNTFCVQHKNRHLIAAIKKSEDMAVKHKKSCNKNRVTIVIDSLTVWQE